MQPERKHYQAEHTFRRILRTGCEEEEIEEKDEVDEEGAFDVACELWHFNVYIGCMPGHSQCISRGGAAADDALYINAFSVGAVLNYMIGIMCSRNACTVKQNTLFDASSVPDTMKRR